MGLRKGGRYAPSHSWMVSIPSPARRDTEVITGAVIAAAIAASDAPAASPASAVADAAEAQRGQLP